MEPLIKQTKEAPMQTLHLHKQQYHTNKLKETKANERFKKIESMAFLLMDGVHEDIALQALSLSRSSYYRWKLNFDLYGIEGLEDASKRPDTIRRPTWTREIEQRIISLRKEFPLFDKQKITVIYKRRYKDPLSESTIGRILTHLLKLNKITRVILLQGRRETKSVYSTTTLNVGNTV